MKDKNQKSMKLCAEHKLFTQAKEWKEVFDAVQSLLDKSSRNFEETMDHQELPEEVQVDDYQVLTTQTTNDNTFSSNTNDYDNVTTTIPPTPTTSPPVETLFELVTPSENSRKRIVRASKGNHNYLSHKKS